MTKENKSIGLKYETWKKLVIRKTELDCVSMDETVNHLLKKEKK